MRHATPSVYLDLREPRSRTKPRRLQLWKRVAIPQVIPNNKELQPIAQLPSTTAVFLALFHSRLSQRVWHGASQRGDESRVRGGPALFITKLMMTYAAFTQYFTRPLWKPFQVGKRSTKTEGRRKSVDQCLLAEYCLTDERMCLVACLSTDRAAGSNLRMVRPSLMSVVKLLVIRARSARQKFGPWYFLAVRRRSHWTSASNWDSKAWKFSHTERKSYACALRYVPCRILLQEFATTQMLNT